jgi:hypothetical protein
MNNLDVFGESRPFLPLTSSLGFVPEKTKEREVLISFCKLCRVEVNGTSLATLFCEWKDSVEQNINKHELNKT